MIIAQISDTHILARSSADPAAALRAENLRRCVAHINGQRVDAVIHTGDSVHHGAMEEYSHLRDLFRDLAAPLFFAPGNRDRHANLRAAFHDLPYLPKRGELLQYVIEDFPLRLVALDSVSPGERKGVFGAERAAWLDETLARERSKPTVLFIHHPPFDIAPEYVGGYRDPHDAEALAGVVRRHPQVKRLLCGHVHWLHRESWAGTVATTMPSVAVDLRKRVDAALADTPVYVVHTSSEDGTIASEVVAVTACSSPAL
jgi:3',5'-cyclic AMP phosphodiesterase CpdA